MRPQFQLIVLIAVLGFTSGVKAQPYESLLAYRLHYHVPVEYDNSETAGAEKFSLLQHTADVVIPIPVEIRQRNMLLITGMFFNNYRFSSLTSGDIVEQRSYTRLSFRAGMNYKWRNERHKTLAIVLPTWASDTDLFSGSAFQIGGLIIHSIYINDRLTVKAGLYYNREQFGNFFMPLAGVDWRLSNGWYIFGVLPGTFNIHKQVNDWFAFSLSERAPNASLLDILGSGDYVRIGRTPYVLLAFDLHFTPSRFMLFDNDADVTFSLSIGHSVFRSYELYSFSPDSSPDPKIEDGLFADVRSAPYLRMSVSLRAWSGQ